MTTLRVELRRAPVVEAGAFRGRAATGGQGGAGSELRISCEVLDVVGLFWLGARSEKRAERGGERVWGTATHETEASGAPRSPN